MNRLYLSAAGLAFIGVFAGASPAIDLVEKHVATKGAAFIDPTAMARSACGRDPLSAKERRAFFLRLGAAVAETGDVETPEGPAASPRLTPIAAIAYPVTTSKASAQGLFDAGVAHMWNFNHGQAINAFKAAQAADPGCAMCYWAEAFAHGPNINAPMTPDAAPLAWAALQKALGAKDGASEKEQALIDALAARYAENPPADRSPLDAAFADAMDEVASRFMDDDFVLTVAAEANMDAQPWDYWMADARTPKGRTARTLELLEAVLDRDPAHIAAIHLYIHITEATTNPFRAVPYAEQLDDLSPGLGHLIHMPSHVYYRIGRFKESIEHNHRAVAADEAFLAGGDASPLYEFGYYVHNVHFVQMSSQMAGDGATALEMAKKLDAKLPVEMALAVPFAQPIKAAPYYAIAQYGAPEDALAMEKPTDAAPLLVGAWAYARGEALARLGRADEARAEAARIAKIIETADFSVFEPVNIPAADILLIEERTVTARAAAADGDMETALAAMEDAVALQEGLLYTEPPYWYYPAKQTLAAMALRAGDAERAEQLFLETLAYAPNNALTLYGLSEAYRAQGDANGRKYAAGLMRKAFLGDKDALSIERL